MFKSPKTTTASKKQVVKGRHGSGNKGNIGSGQNKSKVCSYILKERLFVGWLLNVPATCECISGTDLHRQFYVLPH